MKSGASWCVESGYGYYAVITATDTEGNPAYAMGNVRYSGEYQTPATTEYDNYEFLGWSLDPNATSPDYKDATDAEAHMILNAGEKVTLYAVWSPVVNLSYDGNNATAGSMESTSYSGDTPTTVTLAHEDILAGDNIDLYAPNYKKTGYGFAGWSTDQDAWSNLTDDDESNDPVIYGPNQSFTMTKEMALAETDGKSTLYAVWVPAETDNSGNPVSLQDWTGCSNLTATTYNDGVLSVGKNTVTALTDSRDGNVYTVARLADGNCWMTENLRLDNEPELSSTNTNNPSLPLTNDDIDHTTSNYLSATSNDWCTFTWSDPEQDALCANQSKLNTNNTVLTTASPSFSQDFTNYAHDWNTGSLNANIASYGNYYNWYSATAGNGKYETGSNVTVAGDICPAGWILPIGNETSANGSFSNLDSNMGGTGSGHDGSNNWRSFPNNFVYSGYWYGSSAYGRGSSGYYWSSTASSTNNAYYLGLSSDIVGFTNNNNKYMGYPVRCLSSAQ